MRLRSSTVPLLACLLLAACADTGPSQDAAPRSTATVSGSHVDDGNGRIDTFRVTQLDRRPVGRDAEPSKSLGIDATNTVTAGVRLHVEFEGLARFRNPAKTLFWDPRRVEGSVDFAPAAGAHYVVRGEIGPEASTVWLEDDASHEIVDRKFVAVPQPATTGPATAPGL